MQLNINSNVAWIALQKTTNLCVQPFNLNFRLHTWLSREPWAKLWYCLRALDRPKRGYCEVPLVLVEALTGSDEKTIYRWLKDGKQLDAFRRYKVRGGILRVWLGGLFSVCKKMNLKNWGAVAVVNLLDLGNIRALTTATATQKLQQGSRYAANSRLKKEYRKAYGAPHPNELVREFKRQPSLKSDKGEIPPFVLHINASRIFVSKGFTAFGISQHAVSCNLGIHVRTVQRHQTAVGLAKRQLCQSKSEYGQLSRSLEHEVSEAWAWTDGIQNKNLGYQTTEETTTFFDGRSPGAKKGSGANQWKVAARDLGRRLFAIGRKQKRWFLAKCNIYREEMTLTTMRASRKAFKLRLNQLAQGSVTLSAENEPAPQAGVVNESCIPPGNERHF